MRRIINTKSLLFIFSITLSLVLVPAVSKISTADNFLADNNNLNVILLIGDGMGFEHVQIAEWVELGTSGSFDFRNLTAFASMTTYSADDAVTDSAASATAIACGIKTDNGYLGVDPATNPVQNIVEVAQSMNKSTGLISTATVVHATPAGFYAHHTSRYDYTTIAQQMIDSGVDIILGGGEQYFTDKIDDLVSQGYSMVYNRDELLDETSNKIVGLFDSSYMDLERTRNYTLTPSITEMTQSALAKLSTNENGFFLMVEGAQIDLEAHDHNTVNVVLETIAFTEAVTAALAFAEGRDDTIVIVTADHETGGLVIQDENLNSTLPAEKATEEEKRALRVARADMLTVAWTSTYHTADNVPFYAYGDFFTSMENGSIIDNTDVFDIMTAYYNEQPYTIPEFAQTILGLIPLVGFFAIIIIRRKKE